jgi:hypothetical protein
MVFVLYPPCFALKAQDIRIRVLDGRNGHPIMNVHVEVGVNAMHNGGPEFDTNKAGEAIWHLDSNDVSFFILSDNYADCRKLPKSSPADVNPYPMHSVMQVLSSGVIAENTCSKKRFVAAPQAGEVVFFVRPLHWVGAHRGEGLRKLTKQTPQVPRSRILAIWPSQLDFGVAVASESSQVRLGKVKRMRF